MFPWDFTGSSAGKESACNAGDPSLISVLGRYPGEGIGYPLSVFLGFPDGSEVKNPPAMQRPGFNPWIGKSPLRRACQPTPIFFPPWGRKELNMTEWLSTVHVPLAQCICYHHSTVMTTGFSVSSLTITSLRIWTVSINICIINAFPGSTSSKELPANAGDIEMWVWCRGQKDSLEDSLATHSSILAWRIPGTEEPGGLQSTGSQRVGHNWSDLACTHRLHKH